MVIIWSLVCLLLLVFWFVVLLGRDFLGVCVFCGVGVIYDCWVCRWFGCYFGYLFDGFGVWGLCFS